METLTINEEINSTLKTIYDYIKTDENIKKDFIEYTKTMGIYNSNEDISEEYYIPYIFERILPKSNKSPLNIFNEHVSTELSKAMANSFTSLFEVKRALKSGFEVFNVINEKKYTLNVIKKMTHFRGIGTGQFIVARIFKFKDEYYMIEMTGHLAESKKYDAMRYAMAKILQEPYLVYEDNEQKKAEIEANIQNMYSKFKEAFDTDEIITTNVFADDIICQFNEFAEDGTPINIEGKQTQPDVLKYFEIKDLENDYNNFVEKSMKGFSSHKKTYDVGIIYDKEYGLYVIPFYKTLLTILETNSIENIEGAKECIKHFFQSETISTNILNRIFNKYPNLVDIANFVFESNLSYDEIIDKYKNIYKKHKIYSQTTILYCSHVFNDTIGIASKSEEDAQIDYTNVGRNAPCPCGSGKKYKNCCLK